MKKRILVLLLVVTAFYTFVQTESKRIAHFNIDKKIAVQGYDPVAYFKQNKAVKGKRINGIVLGDSV